MKDHWPEYLSEAVCLAAFMASACIFAVLLEYPGSPVRQAIADPLPRRGLMGLAMGATAVALICSPFGQRSGAHMNPAVTLSFYRLGKIAGRDALLYVAAQFAGGTAGVVAAERFIGAAVREQPVHYVVTTPGQWGQVAAFLAELCISMLLMLAVLFASNSVRYSRWTPFAAGSLVAFYITVESPVSGMSMNPARSWGSAFAANSWTSLWIYFTAPPLGMLAGCKLFLARQGIESVFCAKLHHHNHQRCIFRCQYHALEAQQGHSNENK